MTFDEFVSTYDLRLNAQQAEAVQATEGPVLLLAVPGSGKTTVLVSRLGYMLARGIAAENILTMTYTVAAAGDMRRRFAANPAGKAPRLRRRSSRSRCAYIPLRKVRPARSPDSRA